MIKHKVIILRNEHAKDYLNWVLACSHHSDSLEYRVVDLTWENWLEEIQKDSFDYLLAKPSGMVSKFKDLYDERIMILSKELKYPIFPTLDEILIYENKRYFSYWLKAHNIPHPNTYVFYYEKEALNFVNNTTFPLVAKLNIGASGKGVKIFSRKSEVIIYIHEIFARGRSAKTGPQFNKGKWLQRAWKKINEPGGIKERLNTYKAIAGEVQKGFVIFQQYIPHKFEWRVVRIANSFFAHKKLTLNGKASGSLIKSYENPPHSLLDFAYEITEKYQFLSQAIDVFQIDTDRYLVNEMQCIFGQSDPYQMLVDGIAGRYIRIGNQWQFEPGEFNNLECYDLRVKFILDTLEKE